MQRIDHKLNLTIKLEDVEDGKNERLIYSRFAPLSRQFQDCVGFSRQGRQSPSAVEENMQPKSCTRLCSLGNATNR